MKSKRAAVILLAMAFALSVAGCSSKPQTPTSSPATSQTSPARPTEQPTPSGAPPVAKTVFPHRFSFNTCTVYHTAFLADYAKLSASLPPGFTPNPTAPEVELIGLDAYVCSTAVLDNETVVRDFRMSMVGASVNAPAATKSPGGSDYYLFELVTNNAAACAKWKLEGFPCALGDVQGSGAGNQLQIHVSAAGSPLYDVQGGGQMQPAPPNATFSTRIHWVGNLHDNWGDFNSTTTSAGGAGTADALTTHGGAIDQLTTSPGEMAAHTFVQDETEQMEMGAHNLPQGNLSRSSNMEVS